jgi:hypothetical protein
MKLHTRSLAEFANSLPAYFAKMPTIPSKFATSQHLPVELTTHVVNTWVRDRLRRTQNAFTMPHVVMQLITHHLVSLEIKLETFVSSRDMWMRWAAIVSARELFKPGMVNAAEVIMEGRKSRAYMMNWMKPMYRYERGFEGGVGSFAGGVWKLVDVSRGRQADALVWEYK